MGLFFAMFQRAHQAAIEARRRASTSRYLGWSAVAALTFTLTLLTLLAAAVQLWAIGLWIIAVGLIGLCLTPTLAPWVIRHVLVPRGLVKTAHSWGRVSAMAGTDPAAYALVSAAWAFAGARTPPGGAAVAWLSERRDRRGHLGDAEVVATAFLLARSDLAAARQLLRSLPELVENHPSVRELAGEWLAVDAAERGAWDELLPPPVGTAAWPATPLRFLLEGVAARRLGVPGAPNSLGLAARWLFSPYRRHTWALLAGAPADGATDETDKTDDEANNETNDEANAAATTETTTASTLHDAVAAQVAAELREASALAADGRAADGRAAQRVHRLARTWDRALAAAETRAWLEQRAHQLGAPAGAAERALTELMEVVATELCARVERHHVPAPPPLPSRFGHLLTAKLRHGRLDELELRFERWAERVAGGPKLPPIDEWREFLTVRQAYRDVVTSGGEDLRRLAFPRAFEAANRAAVVLWNQRSEYVLAHAILCWELVEARAVGDVAAIELAAKNSRLPITTRTGRV